MGVVPVHLPSVLNHVVQDVATALEPVNKVGSVEGGCSVGPCIRYDGRVPTRQPVLLQLLLRKGGDHYTTPTIAASKFACLQ